MAEEAIGPIAELLVLIASEANKLRHVQDKVDLLQNQLKLVDPFVKQIEVKGNQLTKEFVRQIRVLVHKAEDVIERHIDSSKWKVWKTSNTVQHISGISNEFKQLWENKEMIDIQIVQTGGESSVQDDDHKQSQSEPPSNDTVVGLEDKVAEIIKQLTEAGHDELDVIGIQGMSGIGKTTLAGEVYSDPSVKNHFDMQAWLFVSTNEPRKVLEKFMRDKMNFTSEMMSEKSDRQLGELLADKLRGTRCLIVLDDVWKTEFWKKNLIDLLSKDKSGGRIILTTQDNGVSLSLQPRNPPHKLKYLSNEESWTLLSKKVFIEGQCPSDLMGYGKTIAENCGGLPLAIVVISGYLLMKDKTIAVWEHVSQTVPAIFNEARTEYDMGEIFALSYKNLPEHLKPCFRYFANFPEGSEIPTRKLTSLWVAEGYISPMEGASLEQVAEQYLRDLIDRNLILLVSRKFDDGVKTCRIHNLLRLFSITMCKEEMDELEVRGKADASLCCKSRRLAIHYSMLGYMSANCSTSSLRSLLCFGKDGERISSVQWNLLCKYYDLIRVLDLWGVDVDVIPKNVRNLSRLKYLSLKSDSVKLSLPSAISELRFLQFLEVRAPCASPPKLDIWKMPLLRHFYFNGEAVIPEPPTNTTGTAIYDLQTLSTISPKSCTDSVLSRLSNIVKLGIFGDLETHNEVAFNNLFRLKLLRKLKLKSDHKYGNLSRFPDEKKFPPTLVKLTLINTELVEDPMGQLGKLPSLQVLKLLDSSYSEATLGCADSTSKFLELRVLVLVNIGITSWDLADGSMPKLKKLVINTCDKLEKLPAKSLQIISTLREIQLWKLTEEVVANAKEIQEFVGKDKLKLLAYH